jgi:hypothetical protein
VAGVERSAPGAGAPLFPSSDFLAFPSRSLGTSLDVTVDPPAALEVEWTSPRDGNRTPGKDIQGGRSRKLTAAAGSDAVPRLRRSAATR